MESVLVMKIWNDLRFIFVCISAIISRFVSELRFITDDFGNANSAEKLFVFISITKINVFK